MVVVVELGGAFDIGWMCVGLGGLVWWTDAVGCFVAWGTGEPAHTSAEAVRLWERESAGEDLSCECVWGWVGVGVGWKGGGRVVGVVVTVVVWVGAVCSEMRASVWKLDRGLVWVCR